MNTDLYY